MQQQPQQHEKTLWETLGLHLPDNAEQQFVTRRVVVVGDALSGKRTFTSLLFAAAMQQSPSSLTSSSFMPSGVNTNSNGGDRSFSQQTWQDGAEMSSDNGSLQAVPQTGTLATTVVDGPAPDRHLPHFPHGAGIAHAFIIQRIPANRSAFVATTEDGLHGGGLGGLLYGVRGVMTEFFCCDAPGALAMALPTVEALDTSVVLLVVDTSVPWRVQDELRRWYGYLNAHVVQTLGVELPKQDEVRRMHMIERQQRFWLAQQQAFEAVRRRWCEREGIELKHSGSGKNNTSLPALQVPKGSVSPLRTILVCTKTDHLERLSREVDKSSCRGFSTFSCNMALPMNINTTSWVSNGLLSALRSTGLTFLELMGQFLRKEAIEHQSAIVAVGSRVNTIATSLTSSSQRATVVAPLSGGSDSDGLYEEAASAALETPTSSHNIFVHPFYKGLWLYIFQLLHESTRMARRKNTMATDILFERDTSEGDVGGIVNGDNDGNVSAVVNSLENSFMTRGEQELLSRPLLDEIEAQISSQFHPHAFLPHGTDHLELLSPFVTSTDSVTLDSIFPSNMEEMEESDSGLSRLHNNYMRQIETALATTDHDEGMMIWDKL